jgi:NAD(P)H-hydrate epimerase
VSARAGWTADAIRAAERPLLAAGEPLMQRAAAGLAREVRAILAGRPGAAVLVLAGTGDNGGDALHAAAELAGDGMRVDVVAVGDRMHGAGRAAAVAAGARVVGPPAPDGSEVAALVATADVVLDGVLGIGARGGLREPARSLLGVVRAAVERAAAERGAAGGHRAGPVVVAVDLPSGVDADTGAADDGVLPAEVTVVFGALKNGLLTGPGAALAGELRLVDIGLGIPPRPGGRAAGDPV